MFLFSLIKLASQGQETKFIFYFWLKFYRFVPLV